MIKNLVYFLSIVFFISSCSTKVEKSKSVSSKEQVDLERVNPLAPFTFKEDSSGLFETFTNFPESNKRTSQKTQSSKERIQPISLYYVQVGLTDSYDEISSLKTQIATLFPEEKITIEYDTPFYRVIIGPFKTRAEANEIFSILERKNYPSLRIRTENSN